MSSLALLEEDRLSLQEYHARAIRLLNQQQHQLENENERLRKENKNYLESLQQKDENNSLLVLQVHHLEKEQEQETRKVGGQPHQPTSLISSPLSPL